MIPFAPNAPAQTQIEMLEKECSLAGYPGSAITFSTYHAAVSAVLEVLGSRGHMVPVVMSITTAPEVLSGVLRAGGDPILLDIQESTLQMDPGLLQMVLKELGAAVVLLSRPGGQPVDPDLLSQVADLPTILDSGLQAKADLNAESICTFNLFDLSSYCEVGALLTHKHEVQQKELRSVRNGVLGLSANLPVCLASTARSKIVFSNTNRSRSTDLVTASRYIELLGDRAKFTSSPEWPNFIVKVDNANKAIVHLADLVEVKKPVFPLHYMQTIAKRWAEQPSYPVAETLHGQFVALPTHSGILGKESMIVERLLEVTT